MLRIAELLLRAGQLAPCLITQMLSCIPRCPQLLIMLLQWGVKPVIKQDKEETLSMGHQLESTALSVHSSLHGLTAAQSGSHAGMYAVQLYISDIDV